MFVFYVQQEQLISSFQWKSYHRILFKSGLKIHILTNCSKNVSGLYFFPATPHVVYIFRYICFDRLIRISTDYYILPMPGKPFSGLMNHYS